MYGVLKRDLYHNEAWASADCKPLGDVLYKKGHKFYRHRYSNYRAGGYYYAWRSRRNLVVVCYEFSIERLIEYQTGKNYHWILSNIELKGSGSKELNELIMNERILYLI